MYALIEPDSCFAGTLLELAMAADRSYMLDLPDEPDRAPRLQLSTMNFGPYTMVNGLCRIASRFYGDETAIAAAHATVGESVDAARALALGLVTVAPDELDWEDEIRIALEERASLSPDALTGMEANRRGRTGSSSAPTPSDPAAR
jgi:benzoyl-CoA-dihydrodiol lyase